VWLFVCLLAGRPVGQSVSQRLFQISELKTHLTHSITHSFPADSEQNFRFQQTVFLLQKGKGNAAES
jgi:hypothetical protein